MRCSRLFGCWIWLLAVGLPTTALLAQPGGRRPGAEPFGGPIAKSKTVLSIEIVNRDKFGGGVAAQDWQRVFAGLDRSVRIRQARVNEQLEIREEQRGRLQFLTVVGELDRQGRLRFPGNRTFTRADSRKMEEWFQSLETFGPQGNPEGQPNWGLNEAQFTAVREVLTPPLEAEVKGLPLATALEKFALPAVLPLKLTPAASAWLRAEFPNGPVVRSGVKGFSKGTALAILLNNHGLGMRPVRLADRFELRIDPLKVSTDVWPIGWPVEPPIGNTVPGLFQRIPVELDNVLLTDLLPVIEEQIKVGIRLDRYRIGARFDVDQLTVSMPAKERVAYSTILRDSLASRKLIHRVVQDDSGRPFIWITVSPFGAVKQP